MAGAGGEPAHRQAVPSRRCSAPTARSSILAEALPLVIGIDRDAQVLRLYENLRLTRRYKIAVGKQGMESSAGCFLIFRSRRPAVARADKPWAGELAGKTIPPGDPRNPLEARWMGYHDGEGIHGTKDVESLGASASSGLYPHVVGRRQAAVLAGERRHARPRAVAMPRRGPVRAHFGAEGVATGPSRRPVI